MLDCEKTIPFNVMVTKRTRNWTSFDIQNAVGIFGLHLLAAFAPFTFTWTAFLAAFLFYVMRGMFGITLSYHRNLSHRSFKLPKWIKYIFAYIGVLCFQGDPITWVGIHRHHHQHVDSEKDAHSPTSGFWFSHMGWIFDSDCLFEKYHDRKNVEDLESQVFYRFIKRTYTFHLSAFAILVYAFGGFRYTVWIVGVSTTCLYHAILLVNSVGHTWGNQTWETGDRSKNNWWLALITFGEGWHNNHHAFEYSARHGLEWWQLDLCWCLILVLEAVGLANNVKLPSEAQKLKKSVGSFHKFK